MIDMAFAHEAEVRGIPRADIVILPAKIGEKVWGTHIRRRDELGADAEHWFSQQRILDLLRLVLQTSFVQNGERILRQTGGIAMGSESSPILANLTLAADEWVHMERLASEDSPAGIRARALGGYKGCARYVDDCLALTEYSQLLPPPQTYQLQYSAKETNAHAVVFTGVGVHVRYLEDGNTELHTNMVDKQSAFEIAIKRYPHVQSTMPKACYIGCVNCTLVYAANLATDKDVFIENATVQFEVMVQRGFTKAMLLEGISRHVRGGSRYRNDNPKSVAKLIY